MKQKTDKLYPSAQFEIRFDLEQRLEKKLNEVKSFNNSIITKTNDYLLQRQKL